MPKAAQDRMLISHSPLLPEGEATRGGSPRRLGSRDRQSHKWLRGGFQVRGRYRKADGVLHLETLSHPFTPPERTVIPISFATMTVSPTRRISISILASPDRWSWTRGGADLAHETPAP